MRFKLTAFAESGSGYGDPQAPGVPGSPAEPLPPAPPSTAVAGRARAAGTAVSTRIRGTTIAAGPAFTADLRPCIAAIAAGATGSAVATIATVELDDGPSLEAAGLSRRIGRGLQARRGLRPVHQRYA